MGCSTSAAHVNYAAQRRTHPPIDFFDEENPPPPPPPISLEEQIQIDLSKIIQGINSIKTPSNLAPVVCLSENSYPLYLAEFIFDEQNDDSILMPVVCFSHYETMKFIYFGSIHFLTHQFITCTENAAFFENAITWGANFKISTIKIFLFDLPKTVSQFLVTDLQGFGYNVEQGTEPPAGNFDIVFTTTNCKNINKLQEVADRGMTVFLFYEPPYHSLPSISNMTGLSFPPCSLHSVSKVIKNAPPEVLSGYTLDNMIQSYFEILASEETNQNNLDLIVSKLRYYIDEMGPERIEDILNIQDKSFEYLERTNFRNDNTICQNVNQSMVTIILMEILQKIPPRSMKPFPAIDLFPGVYDVEADITQNMKIDLKTGFWITTGLWLPAGKVCTVLSSHKLTIQIGSHSLCILGQPGPWKRWPSVTTTYTIEANVPTEIGTPFGGPIFIIAERERPAQVQFKDCTTYPLFNQKDVQGWVDTRQSTILWGEIQTLYCDFNLQSRYMLSVDKLKHFCQYVDKYLEKIREFLGTDKSQRSRVVFDIDLPQDEPTIFDGVVFFSHEYVQNCMSTSEVTEEFYLMLIFIAQALIFDYFLDGDVERSVAVCAVRYSIDAITPNNEIPDIFSVTAPKLFKPLWAVAKQYGANAFGLSIRQLGKMSVDNPDKAWDRFVSILSASANADLSKQLDMSNRPGLLLQTSSERLQQFQLEDLNL